ncbi:MAG: AAA family ATPase [Byssovorax sp.]
MQTIPGYTMSEILCEDDDSVVYSARQGSQAVLLRTLGRQYPTPDDLARLRYGAALSQSLSIDGIVKVLGIERHGDDLVVVMENFDARTLKSAIAAGLVDPKRALSIALSLARTLDELHRAGVVHKSVEPSNVYVNLATGETRLANFDFASRLTRESPTVTSAKRLEGVLAYISPEQTGRMNRTIDHRTDFYSLGVTLYEMLTGELPFRTTDPMTLVHCHIAVRPDPPAVVRPSIPHALSAVVMKLLAKNAEDRYQSAFGLRQDLKRCLDELTQTGTIADFLPGGTDVSSSFHIPDKLYGRDEDKADLLTAFASASQGAAELALVSGYSGVGKSALVNEIHKPLVEARGYFCTGKFDQLLGVPYGAFLQAFQELIRQILSENEDEIAAWKERILGAVGASGQVISQVIPDVERIIGPQPPVPALGPSESENRFNLVFSRFVDAFARREHPLALFLDDLQWADSGSLNLMQLLLKNADKRCLFLIGAYRDNEVFASHPLMLALGEIKKGPTVVTEISLRPLDRATVGQMIADTLGYRNVSDTADLAELVFQKTAGNPFFMRQFLVTLHDRELLSFDPRLGRFRWDIGAIQAVGVTDNVATLMAQRIEKLPEAAQRAVRLASCVGASFDLATLSVVSERATMDVAADLWLAVKEGLIVPQGEAYKYVIAGHEVDGSTVRYDFLHDRVQEAAYAMLSEASRKEAHLQIGRLLLKSTPEGERDAKIFDIVDQLDRSLDLVQDDERLAVARLNLAAGQRAKSSTAYASALGYLTAGAQVLTDQGWETAREVMLALKQEAAECLYLLGRYDEAEKAFNGALAAASSRLEKARIYERKAALDASRGRFPEAQQAGRDALALYGIDLPPPDGYGAAMGPALGALAAALGGRPVLELAKAPEIEDADERMRIELLAEALLRGGYVTPELFGLLAVIQVARSCQHGNARGSSMGYVAYGVMLNAVFGDHETGDAFGRVAMEVSERFDSPAERASIQFYFATLVSPWRRHVRASFPLLEKAFVGCLEGGSLWIAAVSSMHHGLLEHFAGSELHALSERLYKRLDFARRISQLDQLALIACQIRAVTLLTRGSIPEGSPEWMDDAFLRDKLGHFMVAITTHRVLSVQVTYLLGDYPRARALCDETMPGIVTALGHVLQVELLTYQALTLAALYPDLSEAERESALATIRETHQKLGVWATNCPENFLHTQRLLGAEIARLTGDDEAALSLYDQAIAAAAEQDFLQHEAIANELCGKLFLAKGRRKIARAYLTDARYAYRRWGAEAKVTEIDARYGDLLPRLGSAEGSAASLADRGSIDLTAVMRASQAISEEIVLDELLKKLMTTVLESAGAQRGLLLLKEGSPEVVEVEKAGEKATVTPRAEGDVDYARAIVRYVERTHETIVLGDAAQAGQFRSDAYVGRARPRSILCMPIIKQKKLVGVLYLENGLVADAFTEERCKVLDLLTAQAAISLENARLYDTLDHRVKDRTRELWASNEELSQALRTLQDTQKQLVVQEKLASLGTLTSGIAHEIKNPLNFVNNFAELSIGLASELGEEVSRQADRLDEDARAYLKEIVGDLRQNAAKIQEHGKRADSIVEAMLEHARADVGERREIDLNALVSEYAALVSSGQRMGGAGTVTITPSYDPSLPPIESVPQDLGRVFLNIINNACYAALAKKRRLGASFVPEVKISTIQVGDSVEIHIRDNGDGIPPQVRDKIYNPFFTTKPPGEGTGLGLSISYDIVVNGNGGALRFETEEGAFTEFVVSLPMRGKRSARPVAEAHRGGVADAP